MPDPCVLELGLNGEAPDAVGLPTRLLVYARVDGPCSAIRLSVSQTEGGAVLFSGVTSPDSNGTASVGFPIEPPVFPCGFPLWVEAECIEGGTCSKAETMTIACKAAPSGQGNGGTNGGWPWPLPPQLFCPLIGRSFTIAILAGLLMIVVSIAFGLVAGIAAGFAVIAGAFAILAIWSTWCSPHWCSVWGAVLWALKRAFLGGLVLSVVMLNVAGLLLTFVLGATAGILTGRLRHARCQIPSALTPLNHLPLW